MPANIDRSRIPPAGAPRTFNFPQFTRFESTNGLKVLVTGEDQLPLVNATLCFPGSALLDPAGKEGTAYLTAELLTEGTTKRSSVDIAAELEYLGAHYASHCDWNALYLEMNVISRHLDRAMEVFADMALYASFPQDEFERVRDEILVERMRSVDNPGKVASERFTNLLYGDHRYGLPIEGTEPSLKKITRDDVRRYSDRYLRAGNAVLILVGDITEQKARDIVEAGFSRWKTGSAPEVGSAAFDQPQKTSVALVHKPGSAQAELRIGHLGIERDNPDYYAVTLLNEILGGYFLSRINMNLREKHGFTYGAHSVFSYRPGRGPFFISAAVHTENTVQAIQETLQEIRKIRTEKVREEELENARGQLIGVFPIAFETAEQVALGLANIVLSRLPDDYYQTFRNRINAITADDILRVAAKYLDPDRMLIVVTTDAGQVEKDLGREFEVRVFDTRGKRLR